jgi:hypothetical protein
MYRSPSHSSYIDNIAKRCSLGAYKTVPNGYSSTRCLDMPRNCLPSFCSRLAHMQSLVPPGTKLYENLSTCSRENGGLLTRHRPLPKLGDAKLTTQAKKHQTEGLGTVLRSRIHKNKEILAAAESTTRNNRIISG